MAGSLVPSTFVLKAAQRGLDLTQGTAPQARLCGGSRNEKSRAISKPFARSVVDRAQAAEAVP
jgi:hypothetical protein